MDSYRSAFGHMEVRPDDRQLHENAVSNIEQVQKTAHHKAAAVQPPTSQSQKTTKKKKIRRTRYAGHCRRSRDELISDELM